MIYDLFDSPAWNANRRRPWITRGRTVSRRRLRTSEARCRRRGPRRSAPPTRPARSPRAGVSTATPPGFDPRAQPRRCQAGPRARGGTGRNSGPRCEASRRRRP